MFGLIPFSSLEYKLIEIDFCYKLPYDYLLKNCTDESAVPRKLEIGRYLFLIESSAFECSRKNWFWFGWAVEVWNNASKICLMHGNWVLLACLTSLLSKSGCTDTQQTAQSAREAQSTSKDKRPPRILPYSICIGTHTDKYMHRVLKGFPDTDCILLCFMAANQQRNVSSSTLLLW